MLFVLRPLRRCAARAVVLPLLAAVIGGCLDDDRCGPDQRRAGVRCLPALEADAAPGDGAPSTEAQPAACALTPTPDELVGNFALTGAVKQSNCVAPVPAAGAAVELEVSFSRDGDTLAAQFTLLGLSTDGSAEIQADGRVAVIAQGNLLGMDFTAQAQLCFEELAAGTYEAQIALANTSGPLCTFSVAGALARK